MSSLLRTTRVVAISQSLSKEYTIEKSYDIYFVFQGIFVKANLLLLFLEGDRRCFGRHSA